MKEIPKIELKCTRCEKIFYRKRYKIKKSKNVFCSHSCQVRYGIENRTPPEKTIYNCSYCDKKVEISLKNLKRKNNKFGLFCSKSCYHSFQRENFTPEIVELTCSVCGNQFTRLNKIEKSSRKLFSRICCSRECASKAQHSDPEYIKHRLFYQLSQSIRQRDKIEIGEDVDEDYLYYLWKSQDGKCPYSGISLELKKTRNRGNKTPYQASIDRIDSSKGYIRGNIEFISLIANYGKNIWGKEDLIVFCKNVCSNLEL